MLRIIAQKGPIYTARNTDILTASADTKWKLKNITFHLNVADKQCEGVFLVLKKISWKF